MITLRRGSEREHDERAGLEVWRTFQPPALPGSTGEGFGALETFDEDRLSPGAAFAGRHRRDTEIITYVREGTLACGDSLGHSGILSAGEVRVMIPGRDVLHGESNASRTDGAHVFQIWLRPSELDQDASQEQRRFGTAERRSRLRVIASPDGRRGSLRLHQDTLIYSAILERGQHVIHELAEGRSAWIHLVIGEVTLGDAVLTTGDGAGVTGERSVSVTAREESEVWLIDLGERPHEMPGRRRPVPRYNKKRQGTNMMQSPQEHSVLAIYETCPAAQAAIDTLQQAGMNGRRLSIVARDFHTEERAIGFYNWRDRMKRWGGQGAFWGTFWGLLFGGAFFFVPAVGALEGAAVGGAAGLLAAGLVGLGVPRDTVMKYERQVRAGKFLILAHGTAEMIRHARAILGAQARTPRPRLSARARRMWSAWRGAHDGMWRAPAPLGSGPVAPPHSAPRRRRPGAGPPSWLLTIGAHSTGRDRPTPPGEEPHEGPATMKSSR